MNDSDDCWQSKDDFTDQLKFTLPVQVFLTLEP